MALSARLDVAIEPELRLVLESLARENDCTVSIVVRTLLADQLTRLTNAAAAEIIQRWSGGEVEFDMHRRGAPSGSHTPGGER